MTSILYITEIVRSTVPGPEEPVPMLYSPVARLPTRYSQTPSPRSTQRKPLTHQGTLSPAPHAHRHEIPPVAEASSTHTGGGPTDPSRTATPSRPAPPSACATSELWPAQVPTAAGCEERSRFLCQPRGDRSAYSATQAAASILSKHHYEPLPLIWETRRPQTSFICRPEFSQPEPCATYPQRV